MTVHYADDTVTLLHGDCIELMRDMPDASVDAIVTDPPYGLGFMGKGWDDLPPGLPWAQECLRVLKPGGHLLAFGGTRTWHRLACAIEDAGFEIRDSIAWLYGSGFPKSLDVSKAIDKRGGNAHLDGVIAAAIKQARESRGWTTGQADRHFCGGTTNWTWYEGRKGMCRPPTPGDFARIVTEWPELAPLAAKVAEAEREVIGQSAHKSGIGNGTAGHHTVGGTIAEHVDITAPSTSAAERWQGWGTALKPAFEPIVVARKPLTGTVAHNVLAHGTGALNIDACRVQAGQDYLDKCASVVGLDSNRNGDAYGEWTGTRTDSSSPQGRWPANVTLDQSQAAELDRQSGVSRSNIRKPSGKDDRGTPNTDSSMVMRRADTQERGTADSGGASRFFPVFQGDATCATPPETAPTTTETGASDATAASSMTAKSVWPAGGSGAPASSANKTPAPALADTFRYVAKAPTKERPKVDGVAHPTVKPLALMRWLVRLVTPPGGTVLEPFAGSGTTLQAATLEGFKCVGIEREAEYLPLILTRLGVTLPSSSNDVAEPVDPLHTDTLFDPAPWEVA